MSARGKALSDISTPDLLALQHAVHSRHVACPLASEGLLAEGFRHIASDLLQALAGCDQRGVEAALSIALAERAHQRSPALDLVWTGPDVRGNVDRDTGIVLRQLFEGAQHTVVIGGFRFDNGRQLFEPLHRGMVERSVSVSVFLDIKGTAPSAANAAAFAEAHVAHFLNENWPAAPFPRLYYDLRTAVPGPPWVSLHAKCVVIDDERTLITSANFTDRAQTRNIELGVLIEDAAFATRISSHWRRLVEGGVLREWRNRHP